MLCSDTRDVAVEDHSVRNAVSDARRSEGLLLAYSVEKLKDFRAGVSYTIWLNGFVMPLF